MTIIEIIIANLHSFPTAGAVLPMCVHVTVAVNAVCAGQQCTVCARQ